MVADCKSAGLTPYVGSNPTPTMQGSGAVRRRGRTMRISRAPEVGSETGADCPTAPQITAPLEDAGVAQLVEHQPSKLRVAGSSPVARFVARVAQLVERILGKDEVRGSIPRASFLEKSSV